MPLGDQLQQLCQCSKSELVLVAPFIKTAVMSRLLEQIGDGVVLRCVTRWWPDEIASGVSDLEIWPLLKARPNSTLLLRQHLHAKYFRADEACLIGSANLTQTALGWKQPSNLELLIALPASGHGLPAFEQEVLSNAISVDDDLYHLVGEAVAQLPALPPHRDAEPFTMLSHTAETRAAYHVSVDHACWLPTLRNPSDLYRVYVGQMEAVTTASQEAALPDLEWLHIPPGLSSEVFQAFVAALLLQQPIIHQIDSFVSTPKRFGAVRNLLSSLPYVAQQGLDASYTWQTLMRWLLYFLPSRYQMSTPNYSEIFGRRV